MKLQIRRIRALSCRTVREFVRDPLSWVFALAFPLLMLVMFTVIDSRIPPETGMTQFAPASIAPGILVFGQCFLTLLLSLLVSGDRDSALCARLRVTPAEHFEFHLGYALPALFLGLAQGILTMAAAFVLARIRGDALSLADCGVCVLSGVFSLLFCIGLGIFLGSVLSPKAAPGISSVILSAASFLGGCWMDTALLGKGFETVCTLLPWYPSVRMARAVLGAAQWQPADLAVAVFWAALFHLLCLRRKNAW